MNLPTSLRPQHLRPALLGLCLTFGLAACGGFGASKFNPMNWFGGSQEVQKEALPAAAPDYRALVQQVISLDIDEVPGGAIIRATGLPPTQGYWQAELVPQPVDANGRLVLEFRAFPPVKASNSGTAPSREVVVALYLSNYKLNAIREIVVQGEANARSVRR
ncbi:hypothetical protein Q9295_14515 [Xinfangfangia sp. CPCC 101601]|uniref:Lipoprotein n=1 Tax=Pseudogemmobacter lacusdianii TaxID=3069608 RepID=A0ABU0W0V0_9RHOB|nr:hypothetical protein [Xinfangfangia sp. CPCC 101601]MDQ2067589.1 hypothetical protein [Xinfangfangia sp. CPCC 101601]